LGTIERTNGCKQHHHAKGNKSQPSDDSLHTIVNFIATLIIEPGQPLNKATLKMSWQYEYKRTLIYEYTQL
jgi:hypothetical protein